MILFYMASGLKGLCYSFPKCHPTSMAGSMALGASQRYFWNVQDFWVVLEMSYQNISSTQVPTMAKPRKLAFQHHPEMIPVTDRRAPFCATWDPKNLASRQLLGHFCQFWFTSKQREVAVESRGCSFVGSFFCDFFFERSIYLDTLIRPHIWFVEMVL